MSTKTVKMEGWQLVRTIQENGFGKELTELCDKVGRGKNMTKLTAHRCDLCNELMYEEEQTIYKLDVDFIESIAEARGQDAYLNWELCRQCYDEFLAWILKKQKESGYYHRSEVKARRKAYQRDYMRERYQNDLEFRQKVIRANSGGRFANV